MIESMIASLLLISVAPTGPVDEDPDFAGHDISWCAAGAIITGPAGTASFQNILFQVNGEIQPSRLPPDGQ